MTASRTRKQVKQYRRHRRTVERPQEVCAFCDVNEKSPQTVKITTYFKLIKNIFPYSIWDDFTIEDHLLLTPKRHTDSLADLPDKADIEYIRIISKYEAKGYNIYARAPGSNMKSIAHQHTHLIKPGKKKVRFLLYIAKPYLRWVIK
jgi:diadenosine tetraphosphate (Ap4A) HIT family hydrolase